MEAEASILVDNHEPNEIASLIRSRGLPVTIQSLPLGDYVVGGVIVERKTALDLINSIRDNRLFGQLYNIKQLNCKAYLVVVEDLSKLSNSQYNWYMRMLPSIEVRCYLSFNVAFKRVDTVGGFVEFIEQLWKYSGRRAALIPIKPKIESDPITVRTLMLGCIPKIGRVTANALAQKYSIAELSSLTPAELSSIKIDSKPLGQSKANSLFKYLH